MRTFGSILVLLFTLLYVCHALPVNDKPHPKAIKEMDRDNYAAIPKISGDTELQNKKYYVFLEKWQAHNKKEACFAGTSHVRLVAGMYQKQGRQTFLAKAFDLTKDPGHWPGDQYIGSPWSANSETWWTNHYKMDEDKEDEDVGNWKEVSKPNSYDNFGEVKGGVVKEGHEGQDGLVDIYQYLQKEGKWANNLLV